ncbi:Os11g0212801, partial [Oryza sativa Japonica Group]
VIFLISTQDLFERGWGWERLFPYHSSSVEWPQFKKYLEEYSSHNAGQVATLCSQLRSVQGQGIPPAGCGVLHDAANLCIKIENKLLRSCHSALTVEEIILSSKIKECASHMIQSEGESSAAAAGLVCITMEAELICISLEHELDPTETISFSNEVSGSLP